MKRLMSTVLAALLVWGWGSARADVYNWIGPSGGNWNDSSNWTGGGGFFPGAGDTAQIDPSLNCAINVNGAQSVGALDFTDAGGLATGGAVYLNSGALTIGSAASVGSGQTLSGGGTINVPSVNLTGGTLAGTLSITGNVNSTGGTISPGTGGTPGTISVTGNLNLDHASALNYKLSYPYVIGLGVNDYVDIAGNLSLDGTLNLTALPGFSPGGDVVSQYRLFDYTGTLAGPGLTIGMIPARGDYWIDTWPSEGVNLDVCGPSPPGDTNGDFTVNSLDIDAIYQHLTVAPRNYLGTWPRTLLTWSSALYQYDVNGDGVVSQDDVTYELNHYFGTYYGDANLDKATGFVDFQELLTHWQKTGTGVGWAQGDFNGDGTVDFLDFQILLNYWNPGGWNFAPFEAPEPASASLILLGGLAFLRRSRKSVRRGA